ncbi:unnamed protein product [Musa banksii]
MCQQRLSFVLSQALCQQRLLASCSKLKPRYAISYRIVRYTKVYRTVLYIFFFIVAL